METAKLRSVFGFLSVEPSLARHESTTEVLQVNASSSGGKSAN
jgi:hypothetical protein